MDLVDAHVHLSDEAFMEDGDEVICRAKDSGISLLVNVTTTIDELNKSFDYAERFPELRFCHVAGTPPQDAHTDIDEHFQYFQGFAQAGKLAAVGEVGLDYCFGEDDAAKERQKKVLKKYLSLALECELPLVVHCRGAFDDFFHMLDQYYHHDERSCPGMLHCFTGSLEEAQELISRGWYLSISGIVTFKNAQDLRSVVSQIPLDHLLIETDAPFLAPTPYRGKKNEPAYITHTIQAIAAIHGIDSQELAGIARSNVLRFLEGRKKG
ncbi:TatD family hydrolase [Chlamydia caviae]|uniref:Deoxyribonuclease, TatD family n=1 Tax=Chlamydia caviae (strain ATCC VR-813 / DSM 19441 / 03DC25 / GPIC) TaxID=227941 RepID=Q821H0_CHLCV|nr:TatD family hydrolase [Chlamydia caviae]AAP05709.1 deoxyribonuclease, TatD family [Chlamydia caviae GPIC]